MGLLMNTEEALLFIEKLLAQQGYRLNDLERAIFRGAWQGKSYKEIHRNYNLQVSLDHAMRNVGPKLWKLLRKALDEPIRMKDLQGPILRAYAALAASPAVAAEIPPEVSPTMPDSLTSAPIVSWEMTPDVGIFCGRNPDLADLREHIDVGGRLIVILGMAGVGKTTLAIRLAQQVQDQFEVVIWRSLSVNRYESLAALTQDLLRVFGQLPDEPPMSSNYITNLWHYLSRYRCLIVLDGLEAVLQTSSDTGSFQKGCEPYGELFHRIGDTYHRSCLILTSRERPQELANMGRGEHAPVYIHPLDGLGEQAAREMLLSKYDLEGSEQAWSLFVRLYAGNPFALNIAASKIHDLYEGDIAQFLEVHAQETAIFGEIRSQLSQQFTRLSPKENVILTYLVKAGEPVRRNQILHNIAPRVSNEDLDQSLQSLMGRSLIQRNNGHYSLESFILEYAQELTNNQ